jgi:hypothetical protein
MNEDDPEGFILQIGLGEVEVVSELLVRLLGLLGLLKLLRLLGGTRRDCALGLALLGQHTGPTDRTLERARRDCGRHRGGWVVRRRLMVVRRRLMVVRRRLMVAEED